MQVPLPNEDQVPPGPHRELLVEIHRLHGEVGWPGITKTSAAIRKRNDLPDTISHEAISKILRGESFPQWLKLESLLRQYLTWNTRRRENADDVVREIREIWDRAVAAREKKTVGQTAPTDSLTLLQGLASEAAQLKAAGQPVQGLLEKASAEHGLLPVAVAVTPTLPEEGLRLLQMAGTNWQEADIVDLIGQMTLVPKDSWGGHDPYLALGKGIVRLRGDFGFSILRALNRADDWQAVDGILRALAHTVDPGNASAFVRLLSKQRGSRGLLLGFLATLAKCMPGPVAQRTVQQLRSDRLRDHAQALQSLLDEQGA